MNSTTTTLDFKVIVPIAVDKNEQQYLLEGLHDSLLELDIEAITNKPYQIPDGAMGIEPILSDGFTIQLSVELAASLIPPILAYVWKWLQNWGSRYSGNDLQVEIKKGTSKFKLISNMSEDEVKQLCHVLLPLLESTSDEEE